MVIISIFKIVIIIALAGLLTGIFVLLIKSFSLRQKIKIHQAFNFSKKIQSVDGRYSQIMRHREAVRKKWEELLEKIKSSDERDLRLAIIEADNLVDEILIIHDHPGKDMGERLKSIHPNEIGNYNDLWEAHKMRNRIAHETNFHINSGEAQRIIKIYHKTLQDLLSKELELV
ncbi:MAG: hypothetical protein AAB516_02330 [Patescibacteria group bacterium]